MPSLLLAIEHPIQWERHGRDGSKEVISVLANVESVLDTEYHVKLITSANNNDGSSIRKVAAFFMAHVKVGWAPTSTFTCSGVTFSP
jgi:hypothetical protein